MTHFATTCSQPRRAFLAIVAAGMISALTLSKVNAQVEPETLRTANEAKTRIEEAARTFIKAQRKAAIAAKQPSTISYREGKARFDAARASLNAWLDTIALDLKSGKEIQEIDKRTPQLVTAIERVDVFITYAEHGGHKPPRPVANIPVVDFALTVATVFVAKAAAIWAEYFNTKDRAVRETLLTELARLKLKTFEELELEVR